MNKNFQDRLAYWIAFNYLYTMKYANLYRLETYFRSRCGDIFSANSNELEKFGFREKFIRLIKTFDYSVIEPDLHWAKETSCHIIHWEDERYPALLREIDTPPPMLYVQGNVELLNQPQVAVVGSRNPTPMGLETALSFASAFSKNGLVVTSGLALGIDGASHKGAMSFDRRSSTIAVLGSGLSNLYPARHKSLAKEIIEKGGAVISEFPLTVSPRKENFPRRNRVVSGLSLGVLVVEATLKSGSLITARLAAEQGRDVFAIPNSVCNNLSRGCHSLIKQGAALVETPQDVLEELGILSKKTQVVTKDGSVRVPLKETHLRLLNCIGYEMTSIENIIQRSQLNSKEVFAGLSFLELEGYIKAVFGGYCRLLSALG